MTESENHIFELGKALMPMEDVLIIIEKDNLSDDENKFYVKGLKTTQYQLNKTIIEQAIQGSKPAQDVALQLLDIIKMDKDGV